MAAHYLDLDAYFSRVGYNGSRDATLATLRAVHLHHVRAIPFENLDVLLGLGVKLDLASIEQKLVGRKRGGYCFEQNHLLAAALRSLGFRVTPLIARVRWQVPAEVATPFTHMLLRVETEGQSYIADVGFGSMSLCTPLALEFNRDQAVALELRRLVQRDAYIIHQARISDAWCDVHQFRLEEASPSDFEVGNWFTSTYPQSRFKQNLMIARAGDGCRIAVLNREFTIRYGDGRVERRELATPEELIGVLDHHFGLQFPAGTRFGPPGSPWPS